jgi:hypothetical protein
MGMLKEFRDFAMKGNIVDLAVAVIIGGAFGKIVTCSYYQHYYANHKSAPGKSRSFRIELYYWAGLFSRLACFYRQLLILYSSRSFFS